ISGYLAKAKGVTPPHLLGQPEACFFVAVSALTWNLNPSAVAAATYETPGGKVGYEGKLCHAIIEQSNRLQPASGGVRYEHFGPWENVEGKFNIVTGDRGKPYAKPTWTRADAAGVGVIVRALLRGEDKEREFTFNLEQAFPLNSTLWATDPRTQICYLAVRRFASVVAPSLVMGVPFDGTEALDDDEVTRARRARDVTPDAPRRSDFEHRGPTTTRDAPTAEGNQEGAAQEIRHILTVTSVPDGETVYEGDDPQMFLSHLVELVKSAKADRKLLDALWENNSPEFQKLPKAMADRIRDEWPNGAPKAQSGLKV
ncbi:MAG: recombinase RecT, partial [Candidatus Dormibacteria bacterium]